MPNDQKTIKSSITSKQDLYNAPLKKAGDGTMTFMLWSMAGTVIASCSSPIFSDVADLAGGGGGGDVQRGSQVIATDGRVRGADVYIDDGDGQFNSTDTSLGTTNDAGYVDLGSLQEGAVAFVDVNGAVDTATGETLSGIWRSLPYSGSGDLIVSPVTNLLALRLEATDATTVEEMGGEDAFYQETLDNIFGESIVTVSDILDPDNYNVEGNTATRLVSLAAIGLTEIGAPTNVADSAGTLTAVQGLFATYRTNIGDDDDTNDDVVLSGTHASEVNRIAADAESRPVVVDPNEGTPIRMTEGADFVLLDANSDAESLFGFEDPQRNDEDGQPGGARVDGQLVGIYIQALSADGNIAVRFGDATSSVALASTSNADRGFVPGDVPEPFDSTFFYVSAQNFGQLVLSPVGNNGDFITDPRDSTTNPEIRFYVYDGEDATVDVGGSLDRAGELEITVAQPVPVIAAFTGNIADADPAIDTNRPADVSGTFSTASGSGTVQTWMAVPRAGTTAYGTLSVTDDDWTFTLNADGVAEINRLDAGDTPAQAVFDVTATNTAGSDTATLTISLTGIDDDSDASVPVIDDFTGNIADADPAIDTNRPADVSGTFSTASGSGTVETWMAVPRAGTTAYGTLSVTDDDWTFTLNADGVTEINRLDAGDTPAQAVFDVTATNAGGTDTSTLTISLTGIDDNSDTPPSQLTVESEGVREHLLIYGVEFRALVDAALPSGALANYIYFTNNTVNSIIVTGSGGYGIRTTDFSQANIADIWNNDADNTKYVATIIEEITTIPAGNTRDGWRTMEVGGAIVDSSGGRAFINGTDEADLVVTEGSDLMASGWLQVTGGTGDITFGKDTTSGFTASGQLGGESGSAAHTDTRTYTFAGTYGDLVIDGDGDWVYTLGGVANSANAATYQTNIDGLNSAGTETFAVEITRGGVTVEQDIMITVNPAAGATPALVVTNEEVRAFVVINGVEFRVNDDRNTDNGGNSAPRSDYEILFRAVSANSVITPATAPGLIGVNITTAGNNDKFSQVNIARLFNGANLNLYDVAAIIREADESATERTITNWQSAETDFIYDFITASTALDFTVTEDDAADSTARGFLEVTGATDADTYTYTGGTTTVIGTGTNAVTYEIFNGIYGELIVDGDGNWTYVIDNTRQVTQDLSSGGPAAIDAFEVIVTQTAGSGTGTGTAMIDITVNGAADAIDPVDALATAITLTGTVTTLAEDAVDLARVKVADIDITDDGGSPGTLQLAGANHTLFQIDGTELFLRQDADINHETAPSLVVRVQLSESTDVGDDLTISITNVDEGTASFSVTSSAGSDTPAEGHVLTVARTTSDPDGDGTFTYQWQRGGTPITGETSTTYTIAADDVGTALTVVVSYTDGGNKSETVTIPGVTVPAPGMNTLATAIAFSNEVTTFAEDAVDSVRVKVADIDITDEDGDPFGTLELAGASANLFQIDGTELFLRQNAAINHETAPSLVVSVRLMEKTDVTSPDLTIAITNVDEGQASFSVTSTGGSDTPAEGHVLTVARTTSDPDGDGTFAYEWQRDGTEITGEASATYTIVADDVGTVLTVVVTYTDLGGKSETVTVSGASVPAANDNHATAIALDNQVTTVAEDAVDSARMKVADIDITDEDSGLFGTLQLAGTDPDEFEIDGTVLYLKEDANIDYEAGVTTLNVRVQLMEDTGIGANLDISITNVDEGDAGFNVTSNGADINAAVAGDVLTVTSDASNPDPDGNGAFTYQWERDGVEIAGATSNTYTIARDDEGTALTVVVSYTDAGGTPEAVETSPVTVPMDDLATAIALTGTVVTFAEDAVDSARAKVADIDITDEDGGQFGTLELAGANANLFQIDGTELFLRQNAAINHETAPSLVVSVRLMEKTDVTSPDLTIAITNVDEGQASFSVTSTGGSDTPAEGHVLTVARTTSDPDGDGTLAYEWQRDGTEITGEVSATYTIAADDVGTVLTVVVSYTDLGGKSETVTVSGASVPAANDNIATAIALDNQITTVAEDAVDSARMKVADIDITDEDSGLFGTLQLAGTDPDEFEIDGTVLYLKEDANIDYEAGVTTLNVRVQLMEDTGIGANLDISITNVDEGDAGFNVTSNGADINAAVAGDVLTVTSDASNPDPDGNGAFTYQWERDGVEIAGATSNTYTIARDDEGTALTVVVSYTDAGGTSEAVETSPVTVPVDDLATAIALTGTVVSLPEGPAAGSSRKVADIVITDPDGGRSGTLELAGTHADLFEFGGTDNNELHLKGTVVLDHEDVEMLVVSVRLMEKTDVTSPDLTIDITNVDEGTASFSVTSSAGSNTPAEGHVLTVARTTSDPDGDGTLTYQWQRGDADGNNYVAIASATSTTYTIAAADEGNTLRVVVSYTDDGNKSETVTTPGVSVPVPTDNPATAIAFTSTVTTVDEGVSTRTKVADIDITDEDGGQFGTLELAGTNHTLFEIDLPNRALYLKAGQSLDFETLTTLNVRVQLMGTPTIGANLDISITNVDEGDASFNVTSNGNLAAAVEGDVLTVSLDASNPDPDGNGNSGFTYQWMRGNVAIAGATSDTYTIVRADEGTALTVEVTYTDAGGFSEAVETSPVTVPVDDLATAIAFTGTVVSLPEGPAAGASRKVADIVITDPDGGRSGTLELAGTHATLFEFGGTDNNELHLKGTVVLDHEDVEMLVVRVQLMEDSSITSPDLTIDITNVDEGTASFSVTSSAGSDTPAEGHVLTVALATSDPDGDGTFTYQWQRGDADGNNYAAIAGEISTTYTIATADEGNTLRVVVSYTDDGNKSETVTTTPGVSVPAPAGPVDTGDAVFNVTSTGNLNAAAVDDTLTVLLSSISDPDGGIGDGGFSYEWQRDGASIAGAISNTYTIVAADEGTELTVIVSYTDGGGTSEMVETPAASVPAAPAVAAEITQIPAASTNGFYHLPATGQVEVVGHTGVTYSVSGRPDPGLEENRVTTFTSATDFEITIKENGIWEALPTKEITIFSSLTNTAERNFYIHAHDGGTDLDSEQITVEFNRMTVLTGGTDGSGPNNELFIGTTGDDNFSTGGGVDAIVALGGNDTIRLGRNTSDTIYHRFSSSGTDWANTDGGDTFTNYNLDALNTFIFVDTDTADVVSEENFLASDNIQLWATFVVGVGDDGQPGATVSQFEIRFVNPTAPNTVESTITFEYNNNERADAGETNAISAAFAGTASLSTSSTPQEITDHTVWGNYFGTSADAFRVISEDDLPPLIDTLISEM